MKKVFILSLLSFAWLTTLSQPDSLQRKSKFVSTKDYVAMAAEQKATGSEPESWLRKGGLGPSNQKSLSLTSKGLSVAIKSTARELIFLGIPNPVYFTGAIAELPNHTVDFKATVDFTLSTSKARIGIACRFLQSDLRPSSYTPEKIKQYSKNSTLMFTVSNSGHYTIMYSRDGSGEYQESLTEFTNVPFPEEPHQVSINRYGPYVIFSINGKVIAKAEMPTSNYLMQLDVAAGYESSLKATVQKFTYEIFDMDYAGCISGTCADGPSIKRISQYGKKAFVSGLFANGHLPKGIYYYPDGGYYQGVLTDDAPPAR